MRSTVRPCNSAKSAIFRATKKLGFQDDAKVMSKEEKKKLLSDASGKSMEEIEKLLREVHSVTITRTTEDTDATNLHFRSEEKLKSSFC